MIRVRKRSLGRVVGSCQPSVRSAFGGWRRGIKLGGSPEPELRIFRSESVADAKHQNDAEKKENYFLALLVGLRAKT